MKGCCTDSWSLKKRVQTHLVTLISAISFSKEKKKNLYIIVQYTAEHFITTMALTENEHGSAAKKSHSKNWRQGICLNCSA